MTGNISETDEAEQARLEQKLRNAVVGPRPPAPQGEVGSVDTVPEKASAWRWTLALPAPRAVRAFGAIAAVAVVVVAVGASALLMSVRPAPTNVPAGSHQATHGATLGPSYWAVASGSVDSSTRPEEIASGGASGGGPQSSFVAATEEPNGSPSYPPPPPLIRTISGRVTDLAGHGLAGVSVCPLIVGGNVCTEYTTDANGNYSAPTQAAQYLMAFYDDSGNYAPGGWLGASGFTYDPSAAIYIDVTSANVTGVDIALPPSLKATLHVTNTSGSPLSGISCWMIDRLSYEVVSDAGGNCTFVVDPGDTTQFFTEDLSGAYADGFYSASSPNGYSAYGGDTSTLTVPATGLTVTIALPGALYVSGRVTMSGGGALPAQTMVYACSRGACSRWFAVESDGSYSIKLGPGTWTIMAGVWNGATLGYYSTSGFTTDPGSATPIVLSDANITGINIVIPG